MLSFSLSRRPLRVPALLVALAGAAACSSSSDKACVDSTSSALRTCPGPDTLDGIDVSAWQGAVDFDQVAAAGRSFVFMRVASGQNVDTRFVANWPAARNAGLIRGVYQYFYPSRDVDLQADVLITELRNAGYALDDLPPVLDIETLDGLTPAEVVPLAQRWLARVEAALSVRPMIYTANFMSNVTGTHFSSYPLWVANYGVTCPLMPTGWTDWVFWQSSSTGRVPGVTGNVDTDVFNGTLIDLQAFAYNSHILPPPPDAGADASVDSGADASASADAGVDAGVDASSRDAAPDAGASADAGPAGSRPRPAGRGVRRRHPGGQGAGEGAPDPCAPPP